MVELSKKTLLVLLGFVIPLAVGIAFYEIYKNVTYESWRQDFLSDVEEWRHNLVLPSENKSLMWEYRPNGIFKDSKNNYTIKTNSAGFRDFERHLKRPLPTTLRIAFLGDSNTLGLHVKFEDIFVSKFEQYATQNLNINVEALNFSVDGYNTKHILALLKEKVLDYDLDKIVYVLNLNDFDFDDASGRRIEYFQKPKSFFILFLNKLMRFVSWEYYHYFNFYLNKTAVFNDIVEMKRLAAEVDAQFYIVSIPVFLSSEETFANYSLTTVNEELSRFFENADIDYIDLLNQFKHLPKPQSSYSHDVWHPNTEAHEIIAQFIVNPLLNR